ncbi:hypothetical protein QUA86_21835 [Microcoleus sp. F6_B6]
MTSRQKTHDREFLDGTRHAIDPWNQSKTDNRKSLHPPNLSRASQSKIDNRKSRNRMTPPKNGDKFPTIAVEGKKF